MKRTILLTAFICIFSILQAFSQKYTVDSLLRLKNGVGFYPADSSFSMNVHFRIQNRFGIITDEDLKITETEAMVKRMRLKLDGFILNRKLTYIFHLGFSRYDMDLEKSTTASVIRDATVSYKPDKHLTLTFGQTKLQGSKQKMVSSGSQQFIDRSVASNTYGSDRDFGLFLFYSFNLIKMPVAVKTSITTGDGRNTGNTNGSYAYSGRLEVLPLGKFSSNGNYYEGDVFREQKPKIALGAAYIFDQDALKSCGHYGSALYSPRNTYSYFADVLFKYKGLGLIAEYLSRASDTNPFTTSGEDTSYVNIGSGAHVQLSYCFSNKWEIAGRYSWTNPDEKISAYEKEYTYYTLGVSKYLKEHRIKLQSNLSYRESGLKSSSKTGNFILQMQMELGI